MSGQSARRMLWQIIVTPHPRDKIVSGERDIGACEQGSQQGAFAPPAPALNQLTVDEYACGTQDPQAHFHARTPIGTPTIDARARCLTRWIIRNKLPERSRVADSLPG